MNHQSPVHSIATGPKRFEDQGCLIGRKDSLEDKHLRHLGPQRPHRRQAASQRIKTRKYVSKPSQHLDYLSLSTIRAAKFQGIRPAGCCCSQDATLPCCATLLRHIDRCTAQSGGVVSLRSRQRRYRRSQRFCRRVCCGVSWANSARPTRAPRLSPACTPDDIAHTAATTTPQIHPRPVMPCLPRASP